MPEAGGQLLPRPEGEVRLMVCRVHPGPSARPGAALRKTLVALDVVCLLADDGVNLGFLVFDVQLLNS
uniref:Uncharacterized protein n=1 Tax=Sphaerodactylus townsendi TaxID=933632 RepID=A0ACB8EMU1_9SAUR